MCDQISLLAAHDDYRFVGICEHGTLHVSWEHIIIYMTPEDFLSLDYCLDHAVTKGNFFLQDELNTAVMLWILNTAVLLKEEDFLILTDIVDQAASKLPRTLPRNPNAQIWIDEGTVFRTMQVDKNYKLN